MRRPGAPGVRRREVSSAVRTDGRDSGPCARPRRRGGPGKAGRRWTPRGEGPAVRRRTPRHRCDDTTAAADRGAGRDPRRVRRPPDTARWPADGGRRAAGRRREGPERACRKDRRGAVRRSNPPVRALVPRACITAGPTPARMSGHHPDLCERPPVPPTSLSRESTPTITRSCDRARELVPACGGDLRRRDVGRTRPRSSGRTRSPHRVTVREDRRRVAADGTVRTFAATRTHPRPAPDEARRQTRRRATV
jgi:hypothetical protein